MIDFVSLLIILLVPTIALTGIFKFGLKKDWLKYKNLLIIFSLAAGPVVASLLLYFLLLIFPGKDSLFYLIFGAVFFILPIYCFQKDIQEVWTGIKNDFIFLWKQRARLYSISLLVVFILIIIVYFVYQSLAFPIMSHDGLVYLQFGHILARDRSLANYPMVASDLISGFYFGGAQHPPGFPLIFSWFDLLRGNIQSDFASRVISPVYSIYVLVLVWLVLKKRAGIIQAIFGVLIILLTPLFVVQAYDGSIDAIRIFFMFSSLILLSCLVQKLNKQIAIITGLSLGLALFTHASALLFILVAMFSFLFFQKKDILLRFKWAILVIAVTLLTGGWQYVNNQVKFQNILGPKSYSLSAVYGFTQKINWAVKNSSIEISMSAIDSKNKNKQSTVFSESNNIKRLQFMTKPEIFGLSFYLFFIGIYWWVRHKKIEAIDKILLISLALYSIPVLYRFYANERYIFTVLPILAYYGGLWSGSVYNHLKKNKQEKSVYWVVLISLVLIVVIFFSSSSTSSKKCQNENCKIKYILSNKNDRQKITSPGIIESINFLNKNMIIGKKVLTTEEARFSYFSQMKPVCYKSPEAALLFNLDSTIMRENLRKEGIAYIMIDYAAVNSLQSYNEYLWKFINNPDMVQLVFDAKTRVYRLKE